MDHQEFDNWLSDYGKAWESKDADAFGKLFAEQACYRWTPFSESLGGRENIVKAIREAITTQSEISFHYEILGLYKTLGTAHWSCTFVRRTTGQAVTLDGILTADFNDQGICRVFREWWHSNEIK